jgi:drug/metabolite transporter (DMT)-like permease
MAILGGLGAAVAWAVTILCAARASRIIDSASVLGWVMLTGFCIVVPWGLLEGIPDDVGAGTTAWLLLAGAGNLFGLFLSYTALRTGDVGIIAPIISTEGAVAAILAVIAGEQLGAGSAAVLAVIALGIALAATTAETPAEVTGGRHPAVVPLLSFFAACSFGLSIYATARASADLPIAWAVAPPRLLGVLFIALPLAATARLRITRDALPLVVGSGIGEVVGFALFVVGARHSVAIAAVLSSQFAAVAAVAAYFLFRERLTRLQLVGVVTIVTGVTVLTVLQV